jgi:hypothetical protein
VQLRFVNAGVRSDVTTSVTFTNNGMFATVNFRGDQRRLFPINAFVPADFNTGIYRSTLIAVKMA